MLTELAVTSSSPRRIRQNNAVVALQALHRMGQLSRAELARQMGLNRSSSGNIIAELKAAGLVREYKEKKGRAKHHNRAGRPGIMLELVPDAICFIGTEIGVEHVTTVKIDLSGRIIETKSEPFNGRSVAVSEAVIGSVNQSFASMSEEQLERCRGFGLSAPAQMGEKGHVLVAPLLDWKDVNLAELTRKTIPIDVPILVENDANAFAIGATYNRENAMTGVTAFLVIESGVGCGITIDGNLFRGSHGRAGEIGHLKVPGRSERNLEQAIGLDRLLSDFRSETHQQNARLSDFVASVQAGEKHAVVIAKEWAEILGFALVQLCRLVDPHQIVLGGSVSALYPFVAEFTLAHMKFLQAETFPLPEILLNEDVASGSAFGAACMMHKRFLSIENDILESDQP